MTRAVMIAVLSAGALAFTTSPVHAQFTNYADPPCDQYNQNCPPAQGTAGTSSSGPPVRTAQAPTDSAPTNPRRGRDPVDNGGPDTNPPRGPIEVREPVKRAGPVADGGKLPFTGTDLTVLLIVALLLLAVGSALALASRRRDGAATV